MTTDDGRAFHIVEVSETANPLLPEMEKVLRKLLPQLRPGFREILAGRFDDRGRVRRQIMAGLCGGRVAGLMQVFYRPWRDGLVGNVDLLGISARYKLPVAGVVWLTEPDEGPPGSWTNRRVRMFERLGGQARRDLRYRYPGHARRPIRALPERLLFRRRGKRESHSHLHPKGNHHETGAPQTGAP